MTNSTALALPRRISESVEEYDTKREALADALSDFEGAGKALMAAATIQGSFGRQQINTGSVYGRTLEMNLLVSAWMHIYDGLNIKQVASAKDKALFEQSLSNPPPFTIDNIRSAFGDYILDPRGNVLRGLAECFADLDPAYKSHENVKIGVKGLPKRVILHNVGGYGWGRDKLQNTLNALAVVMGRPMIDHMQLAEILKDGDSLRNSHDVWLKRYANGNGHLFFGPVALREINLALAEFYGNVLPDAAGPTDHKRESREVAKDLQYYPTPRAVVKSIVDDLYLKGQTVLEPSCGCGRFMDALRDAGATVTGVEYDIGRALQAGAKGHYVHRGNFLEMVPGRIYYDKVVMNPPFYGQHYAKHVEHALRFLKPGGQLIAILPVTARYNHGLLDKYRPQWQDLPVGSFAESGTNINTTICKIFG